MLPLPPSTVAAGTPAAATGGAPNTAAKAEGRVCANVAGLFGSLLRSVVPPAAPAPGSRAGPSEEPSQPALPAPAAPAVPGAELAQAVSLVPPATSGQTGAAKPAGGAGAVPGRPSGRARPSAASRNDTGLPAVATAVADPALVVLPPQPPPLPPPDAAVPATPAPAGPPATGAPAGAEVAGTLVPPRLPAPKHQPPDPAISASSAAEAERTAAEPPFMSAVALAAPPQPPTGGMAAGASMLAGTATAAAAPARATPVAAGGPQAQPGPPAAQLQPVLMRVVAGGGPQAITVSLHPAELGQVEIRVECRDGGSVQVALTVTQPETLHALVRDQAQLNDVLARAGVAQDARSLSFHLAPPEPAASLPAAPTGLAAAPAASSQSQGGATFAGGGPGTPDPGGQHQASQDGGRYRPAAPAAGATGFAAADGSGEPPAVRWLRLGIDITA